MFTAEAQSPLEQHRENFRIGHNSRNVEVAGWQAVWPFSAAPFCIKCSLASICGCSPAGRTEQSCPTDRRARDQLSLNFCGGKCRDDTFRRTTRGLDQRTVTGAAQPLPIRGPPAEVLP